MEKELISHEELSIAVLEKIAGEAGFKYEFIKEEQRLILRDKINVGLSLDEQKRFITLLMLLSDDTGMDLPDIASRITARFSLIKATAKGNILFISYDLWCEQGITKENLVSAVKAFIEIASAAPAAVLQPG